MINQLVLENLKHRPVRTGLSILAIGTSVTLVLTIVGLSHGMLEESARRSRGVGADILVSPPGTSFGSGGGSAPMDERVAGALEQRPGVAMALATVVYTLQFPQTIQGVDWERFDRIAGGVRFREGRPFASGDEIIVDEDFAAERKLRVGSTVNYLNTNWRVCGIIESGKLARLFLPLRRLQELTSNTGRVSQIFLKAKPDADPKTVAAALKRELPDYRINTIDEIVKLYSVDAIAPLRIFINVIVGIAVVIGFAFVFLSMYTAVLERTREIGILKALGASPGYVMAILLREAALLAVGGAVMGILFSFGTRLLFHVLIPASMQQKIMPEWWPIAGLIALGGAVLGTLYPGYKAAKQDAIEALAYE